MEMNKDDLMQIIKTAVSLGRLEVMAMQIGGLEWISRPQAKSYLRTQGLKPGLLEKWEDEGLLKSQQSGTGGTKKYRATDIQKAILAYSIAKDISF